MLRFMMSLTNPLLPGEFSSEEHPAVKVVIAYEDLPTGQRAMATCEHLIRQLGHDFEFTTSLWNFEVLCVSELKQVAAQDAAEADMVMIAAHGRRILPAEVKDWVNSWLAREHEGGRALVALLDSAQTRPKAKSQRPSYLEDYLHEAAEKAKIDFFAYTFPVVEPSRDSSAKSKANKAGSSTLGDRGTSFSGWGIND